MFPDEGRKSVAMHNIPMITNEPKRPLFLILALPLVLSGLFSSFEAPAVANESRTQVETATGVGADLESAKNDACREAVRKVVGAYLASKTITENDELIVDKVVSLSSGFVEKMETLKEWKEDGIVRVEIRATVRVSKLLDTLKANKISIKSVDGPSLGAQLLTKGDQRQGEVGLVEAAFEDFPAKWFKADTQGDPRLGDHRNDSNVGVVVTVVIEPDLEGYLDAATKLDEAFKATDRPHGKFEVDSGKLKPGMSPASSKDSADRSLGDLFPALVHPETKANASALNFINGIAAFPDLIRRYPLSSVSGERLMEPGFIVVMFPVKFRAQGKQSTWHWYGIKLSEAMKFVPPLFRRTLKCTTALEDDRGEELAIDTCEIPFMGIGGMRRWEDFIASNRDHQGPVAIAPAAILGNSPSVDWLIPKFSCERTIFLGKEDVRKIAKVKVELE
jgi:hypothetical protein